MSLSTVFGSFDDDVDELDVVADVLVVRVPTGP
jgi:hypothetical protein